MVLADLLREWLDGAADPSPSSIQQAFQALLLKDQNPVEIAALLTYLRCRGEAPPYLVAAAAALRSAMIDLPVRYPLIMDTCGTGGDGQGHFNVSTATALLLAAMGIPVVKHGNRSFSSRTGSADVLQALGVPIDLPPERALACLEQTGFTFCFAPLYHPAMKRVAEVRRQLRFRTLFNLIGPLTNPARPTHQLIGVSGPDVAQKIADALACLGTQKAFVVWGTDGTDEVSVTQPTQVWIVEDNRVAQTTWSVSDFGLPPEAMEACRAACPESSALMIERLLNEPEAPGRQLVLANGSAGLLLCGKVKSLREGVELAQTALQEGAAANLLKRLRALPLTHP